MADKFEGFKPSLTSPGRNSYEIAPSDTTDLPHIPRRIYVNTTGTLTFTSVDDDASVTLNVFAGAQITQQIKRVFATGTTAELVAFY